MDPARAHTSLHDLESPTLAQHDVLCWYAYVFENQVCVAMRSVIVAVNRKHTLDCYTWGICRNDNDGLLFVLVGMVGIGLSQDDINFATRIACTGYPPFL